MRHGGRAGTLGPAYPDDLHSAGAAGTYDAAVVTKDYQGMVHVSKDEMATRHGAWGGCSTGRPERGSP
jgi:hypothetical protein